MIFSFRWDARHIKLLHTKVRWNLLLKNTVQTETHTHTYTNPLRDWLDGFWDWWTHHKRLAIDTNIAIHRNNISPSWDMKASKLGFNSCSIGYHRPPNHPIRDWFSGLKRNWPIHLHAPPCPCHAILMGVLVDTSIFSSVATRAHI